MKRVIGILLALCLLLSGCVRIAERNKEPVTFYYPRTKYQSGSASGVIASEEREASGHLNDLNYLLALYLTGPSGDALQMPLPRGTSLLSAQQNGTAVELLLSNAADALPDAEFSLACACLALTCMDIVGAETVTIATETRSVTLTRDNLTLFDDTAIATTEETK